LTVGLLRLARTLFGYQHLESGRTLCVFGLGGFERPSNLLQPFLCQPHLLALLPKGVGQAYQSLGDQFWSATRLHARGCFRRQHQLLKALDRDRVAWVAMALQEDAPVGRTGHRDDRRLVAKADMVAHPAEGGIGIGLTGRRDLPTGQIGIIQESTELPSGQEHLSIDERLAELLQDRESSRDDLIVGRLEGPTDSTGISPARLVPSVGDGVVFDQGMWSLGHVLQVGIAGESGHQQLQEFGLRGMVDRLLSKGDVHQCGGQAELSGELAPHDQHGVVGVAKIGVGYVRRVSVDCFHRETPLSGRVISQGASHHPFRWESTQFPAPETTLPPVAQPLR
jgi:hypothetical protein